MLFARVLFLVFCAQRSASALVLRPATHVTSPSISVAGRLPPTSPVMQEVMQKEDENSPVTASPAPVVRPMSEYVPQTDETRRPAEVEAAVARLLEKSTDNSLASMWRRAAFWEPGKATVLELVNVLGRFDSCSEWITRTEFYEMAKKEARTEDERNALTLKRHEMALRMKCAERAALFQNAPDMPFKNEALAASFGLTCEDFNSVPVTKDACEVLYDALAESRSTLIPYAVMDSRIHGMIEGGKFNEVNFRLGHAKSTIIFIVGLFFFGKANFIWILVSVKLLHDYNPELIPGPKELGLFKIFAVV